MCCRVTSVREHALSRTHRGMTATLPMLQKPSLAGWHLSCAIVHEEARGDDVWSGRAWWVSSPASAYSLSLHLRPDSTKLMSPHTQAVCRNEESAGVQMQSAPRPTDAESQASTQDKVVRLQP